MKKLYFCQIFFIIDWLHKHLKNTIDLLFYTSMDFLKMINENVWKKILISQQIYHSMWVAGILEFCEVLFCTYCKGLFSL